MAVVHAGNAINQMTFEEHDGVNNAKRVNVVAGGVGQATVAINSAVTIFAVVNTAAAGQASVKIDGNVTITDSKGFIGLTTTTLGASPAFIGIATIANQPPLVASAAFIGLVTVAGIGTLTLSDPKGFIGLTTVIPGANVTLNASAAFIGITTIANQPPLIASAAFIGLVTVAGIGTLTLADPKGYIGLTTATLGASPAFVGIVTVANQPALVASPAFIGLVTIAGISTLTLSDPKGFIGLVTAVTINGGTNKTLINLPITLSTGSAATIFVPTNNFYITNLLLNSNATVRVNIRSGATYLTGNASLGINLNPGSGFVLPGSPDSPWYKSLSTNVPIVIEKADSSGVIAQIGGSVTFFDAL